MSVNEITYATIGGGLGSFIWVDFLRIFGVKSDQIAAVGIVPLDSNKNIPPNEQQKPYWHYQQLCLYSQIPPTKDCGLILIPVPIIFGAGPAMLCGKRGKISFGVK
ncbi:MAG: hypothetical protein GDA56_28045 [Hormoscilla sp. GM7CHS1pb]|nr:hypothetical protein [Hormoscilla sp. GM7CHS1pb]